MSLLKDQNELDAYYLSDPAHARAAGVLWPAIVERRIDKLFEIALRPDKVIHNELFQPSGALGNYAVKVRLAYLLGWIEKDIFDDLIILSRIRNRFAHAIDAKDFTDQRINTWLKNMKVYQLIPGMVERFRERAATDPTRSNTTAAFVAESIIVDEISAFRFCIDLIIRLRHKFQKPSNGAMFERLKDRLFCRKSPHVLSLGSIRDAVRIIEHLDKCGTQMAKNLANLPENWLVSPPNNP